LVGEREGARPVGAELAAAEDEARHEPQHVDPPRTDERLVEVVQVEGDLRRLLLLRALFGLLVLFGLRALSVAARELGEHVALERAEVLEVLVAADPTLAARSLHELGARLQYLVVKRRRAAQKRERRRLHP